MVVVLVVVLVVVVVVSTKDKRSFEKQKEFYNSKLFL